MFCPACGTQNEANAFKCVKCGKLLQQVVPYGDEVYDVKFNLQPVDQAVLDSWKTWRPNSFSTPGAILLDIFTCGLFGLIYYGLFFGELPKVSNKDFGVGQAIGFSFIPYFSLYWIFRFWWGLCDRINLQLRLRGQQQLLLPRELATAMCILFVCSLIPYAGILAAIAGFVCREIFIGKMQNAVNMLAKVSNLPKP